MAAIVRNAAHLDDLDAEIVALLRADGRRPNVEIARHLGVAEGTVRKRIERLTRERIIQIGAWADPLKVGYHFYTNLELEVDIARVEAVAERVAKLPEIFFLGISTGRFGIFAVACFRSTDHFHEFMTERLARVPGIHRAVTSNITRIVKREHAFPVLPTAPANGPRRNGHRLRGRAPAG
ncbi:MAG: Lrp/AsnC family transcriptional regulator [Candidatus Rokubacteria bacterium]|nr:Lrp/AsnC family transcriptional regulator [Candidatus Rokubacteria bacterium]